MERIEILQAVAGGDIDWKSGDVVSVKSKVAERLVKAGIGRRVQIRLDPQPALTLEIFAGAPVEPEKLLEEAKRAISGARRRRRSE